MTRSFEILLVLSAAGCLDWSRPSWPLPCNETQPCRPGEVCGGDGMCQPMGGAGGGSETAEKPGISPALFATPFYTCLRTFFVATGGSDAADGSADSPWKTIQHANDSGALRAGDCVNVAAGTYRTAGIRLSHGGNAASPTGYVAYRSATLGGARVVPDGAVDTLFGVHADYVVIDGFEVDGNDNQATGACIRADAPSGGASHHLWVLNNDVHHCGLGGLLFGNSEYAYLIHNVVHGNSNTNTFTGSGIMLIALEELAPGYAPTTMDGRHAPFHNLVEFNVSYENFYRAGMSQATFGNGMNLNTFGDAGPGDVLYAQHTLVAFNVTYANGGAGIWSYRSAHVTFANNTSYGDNLDTRDSSTARPEIGVFGGHDNVVINNAVVAVPGAGFLAKNCTFLAASCCGDTSANDVWQHNLESGGLGVQLWDDADAAAWTCDDNKCETSPQFAAASTANFALQPGSPAIGYGQRQAFLPAWAIDAGACASTFSTCP